VNAVLTYHQEIGFRRPRLGKCDISGTVILGNILLIVEVYYAYISIPPYHPNTYK
jgi:hypothetical protein